MKGHARFAVAAAIFCLFAGTALGATRTWTGASLNMVGPNNSWADLRNWNPNAVPTAGDDLVFNPAIQTTSDNFIAAGTTFNTISLTGHLMTGNAIALNAGITAGSGQISLDLLKLNADQTFTSTTAGNTPLITSPIDLNGRRLTLTGDGNWTLVGPISGVVTGITKAGSGVATLAGPNSYNGFTSVQGGVLQVFGSQPNSVINVAGGTLGGGGTVASILVTAAPAAVAPGGVNNGTGILTANGSLDFSAGGTKSLIVDLKGTTAGSGYDQLKIISGGTVTLSNPVLTVVIGGGFQPAPRDQFVIIDNDGTDPVVGTFSTRAEGSVFTVSGTTFVISYRGGDGNDVVLRVPSIWDGGGADNNWMTPGNWVGDVAPAAGHALLFPFNVPRIINVNNFPVGTQFPGLYFTGGFQFSGNRITLGNGGIVANQGAQAFALLDVTLAAPSLFQAGTIGAVAMRGALDLGPHLLTVQTLGNGTVDLAGPIAGTGEIHKFGDVVARLDVESTAQTAGNPIKVFSGHLLNAGAQITSPVILDPALNAPAGNIEFSGTGSIGALTVGGAEVSAGPLNQGTGLLQINGNLSLQGGTGFATLLVTLGGATANNQDKLIVQGLVNLQSAEVEVEFKNGFAPPVGASFVIVANDGVDPVQGAFFTKAEGSTFVVGGTTFQITYQGGDGNDIVLTVVAAEPTPAPSPSLANISTRLRVLTDENVLIGGMILTGNAPKKVIIRAIGPTLTDLGLPGALSDPTLELFRGNTLVASNDDWRLSSQQAEIANSGFAPGKDAESAILMLLDVNQNYTAVVRGKNGGTGIGVVEAFDLDELVAAKIGNISTRGFVDVDDNVMIAGLIVGPSNAPNISVLVRALGPTLGDFGVQGFLANPTLDLVGSNGTVIRSNNDWKESQQSEIQAAQLAPTHDTEAALIQSLPPGAYTAVVRGLNNTTGVGLVEVYNIP